MTTTVLMVRHASHDRLGRILCGRMPGVELSEQGRAQARSVGERLAGQRLAAVYCSPLERTRQTAQAIAEVQGLQAQADDDLIEIDFGRWSGSSFESLGDDPAWRAWNERRGCARAPGGETMKACQARVVLFLDRMRRRHPQETVAAVSHGDVIKAAAVYVLGLSLDHLDRLEVSPASVSRLVVGDWGAKVHSLNEAGV